MTRNIKCQRCPGTHYQTRTKFSGVCTFLGETTVLADECCRYEDKFVLFFPYSQTQTKSAKLIDLSGAEAGYISRQIASQGPRNRPFTPHSQNKKHKLSSPK